MASLLTFSSEQHAIGLGFSPELLVLVTLTLNCTLPRCSQSDGLTNRRRTEPIYKQLGRGWEKAFQRRSQIILKQSVPNFKRLLLGFHAALMAREHNFGNPRLPSLIRAVESFTAVFQDLANGMTTLVNNQQKECNRGFTPAVQEAMTGERQHFYHELILEPS